jgi:hypothetical protein
MLTDEQLEERNKYISVIDANTGVNLDFGGMSTKDLIILAGAFERHNQTIDILRKALVAK